MKDKLAELQRQYEEKVETKEDLRKKAELTELRLERAAKIVTGLADERVRWEESVKVHVWVKEGSGLCTTRACVFRCHSAVFDYSFLFFSEVSVRYSAGL